MAKAIPIFRIFDYSKAIEYYIEWLEFTIDWEDKVDRVPLYMQISKQDIVLHLSEHHGDCSPGARVHIENFENLREYHNRLVSKGYIYNRPGIEPSTFNRSTLCMELIDPFGNRLTLTGKNE